jgi:general secretion pathway protein K
VARLLSVLLLVAVMAVIAAVMLDRLNLAAAGRQRAGDDAGAPCATSAETVAMARLKAWSMRTIAARSTASAAGPRVPVAAAARAARVRIDDAGNCFNVNSLVQQGVDGTFTLRPVALTQLRALMAGLAVPANEAVRLSDAMADWIDSDERPAPNGAEDDVYRAGPVPYRPPNRLIGDVSELRGAGDDTGALSALTALALCAAGGGAFPVNVNTLRLDQIRLLTMLSPATIRPNAPVRLCWVGRLPAMPARRKRPRGWGHGRGNRRASARSVAGAQPLVPAGSGGLYRSGAAGGGSADRYRGDARARGVPQLG